MKSLRIDPTRTSLLRKKFVSRMTGLLQSLKRDIYQLVVVEDAFGLKRSKLLLSINTRWKFNTDDQKIEEFNQWLKTWVDARMGKNTNWWHEYILQGYSKGSGRAYADWKRSRWNKQNQQFYKGSKEEFMQSSFSQPVQANKLKLLVGRTFNDLKGITDAMSAQVTRQLADGLVTGMSPREIAEKMNERVQAIGMARANSLARTEIIRAHAEGQLDTFEQLGVTHLGVAVEWSTAEDERVCPKCKPLGGMVLKIEEAKGMLPRHPNCRCAWIPANVGEADQGRINTKTKILKAIRASLSKDKKQVWAGADLNPDKQRPVPIANFDPNQPRDRRGRWMHVSGAAPTGEIAAMQLRKEAFEEEIVRLYKLHSHHGFGEDLIAERDRINKELESMGWRHMPSLPKKPKPTSSHHTFKGKRLPDFSQKNPAFEDDGKTLYHFTLKDSLPKISAVGLVPGLAAPHGVGADLPFADETTLAAIESFRRKTLYAFTSLNPNDLEEAILTTSNRNPADYALLRFKDDRKNWEIDPEAGTPDTNTVMKQGSVFPHRIEVFTSKGWIPVN